MGNGFMDWFSRSYKGIIVALVAIMAITLVMLAVQHVAASQPADGAEPGPVPTFTSNLQPLVTFVGDSYTEGSGENTDENTRYTTLVRHDMEVRMQNVAVGGSGYVHAGNTGKPFSGQVGAISPDAALVVVYGSRNDLVGADPASVSSAASDLYSAIKAKAKNAALVVIGPSFVENPTPTAGVAQAAAIRQAATDADATYVDAADWFHGTPANYIGADGIHPTDAGHRYLATKIEPIIRAALNVPSAG
jgi:lysophospholipase L1-like esterase